MDALSDSEVVTLSVETGVQGSPHTAMLCGQQSFPPLKNIEIPFQHVRRLDTITDGFCAYDSLIRGTRPYDNQKPVSRQEMHILKRNMIDECVAWVTTLDHGCEGERGAIADSERLSHFQIASVKLMSVPVVVERRGENPTMRSFRDELLKKLTRREWMPVPHMAFASHALKRNILVWELIGDGTVVRPYYNCNAAGSYNGLYLSGASTDFIHVLYSYKDEKGNYVVPGPEEQASSGSVTKSRSSADRHQSP